MASTKTAPTTLDTGHSDRVFAVAFHPDGIHLSSGNENGIRRWRLPDGGQQVSKQTGMIVGSIAVSRDHKWAMCGTWNGASVWDGEIREKVIDVEGTNPVWAVDVSSDSTRFVTGTNKDASIWSISSGKRLVGPLEHDNHVLGVKFSPDDKHFATACQKNSVRVFDSNNGDEVINIRTITVTSSGLGPITPLVWSNDGRQIFAVSKDNKIKCFDVSTGSQLAESQILSDDDSDCNVESIALATNGSFITTYAGRTIFFLDPSTLTRFGPIINDSESIASIALSLDGIYLITGRNDGKINVHNIGHILLDVYNPPQASTRGRQQEEPRSEDGGGDLEISASAREHRQQDEPRSKDGGGDLLEVEVPSGTPAPEFDYGESLSPASSAHPHEDEPPPLGAPDAVRISSDAAAMASPVDTHPEENANTTMSSRGILMLKRWLPIRIGKGGKDPGSREPNPVPRESSLPAQHQSPSQSLTRVEATNEGPSWMAATKRVPRAVAKPVVNRQRKSPAKPTHSNKGASRSGKGTAGAAEVVPAQPVKDESQPSAGRFHVADQRGSGDAIVSVRLPAWLLCRGSTNDDGTHG